MQFKIISQAAFAITILISSSVVTADDFTDAYEAFQQSLRNSDTETSIELAKQVWLLAEEKFGEGNENTLNLHHAYAHMLVVGKQNDKALDEFNALFKEYENAYGEDSPATVISRIRILTTLNKLTYDVKSREARLEERVSRYLVLSLDDVAFSSELQKAELYHQATRAAVMAQNVDLSPSRLQAFADTNLALSLAAWGDDDIRTLESRFLLAAMMEYAEHADSAIEHYELVAKKLNDNDHASHHFALSSHARLVNIFQQNGESDKATEHCQAIGKMTPLQADTEVQAIYRAMPEYPKTYIGRNVEGIASVSFVVDAEGFAKDINVTRSKGGKGFGKALKEAVKQWRFAPKFVDGIPVVSETQSAQFEFSFACATNHCYREDRRRLVRGWHKI